MILGAPLFFYGFAFLAVMASLLVILMPNPVHAVLSLISAFLGAAGLFILVGAEFIALSVVIVYVGAVAVFFLFVVMMIPVKHSPRRHHSWRFMLAGLLAITAMASNIWVVMDNLRLSIPVDPHATKDYSSIRAIGSVLYTEYFYPFQLAGIILLVAMIGAILLTLRSRTGVKKQTISTQLQRNKDTGLVRVSVKTGQGVQYD